MNQCTICKHLQTDRGLISLGFDKKYKLNIWNCSVYTYVIKHKMKYLILISILLALYSCNEKNSGIRVIQEIPGLNSNLTTTEVSQLDSLNIHFQHRANCYAYSSKKNAQKSNGEAHSNNLPKMIDDQFPRNGLYLLINDKEKIQIHDTNLGCKLYLINTSESLIEFNAIDSRINIFAEALNENNKWSSISFLPFSSCGNSYHTIKLDKNEYWDFNIPIFKGTMKTKIRYRLQIDKENKIVSNEVSAYLNPEQFNIHMKEGYQNNNIMDPYTE